MSSGAELDIPTNQSIFPDYLNHVCVKKSCMFHISGQYINKNSIGMFFSFDFELACYSVLHNSCTY